MEGDSPVRKYGNLSEIMKGNGPKLPSVNAGDEGVGLPYAPIDWPNPGDHWRWKAGKRTSQSRYFTDRYIYPPQHLCGRGLNSKRSLEEFVRSKFPGVDVRAFFASFSWKIPSQPIEGMPQLTETAVDAPKCKAGNKSCHSLLKHEAGSPPVMFCDGCCSEPRFCRECCCILCMKTFSTSAYEGLGYVRCETLVDGNVCGHVADLKCALKAFLASVLGGDIGLDAEYYCRFCNEKTDLVPHAEKLLKICQQMTSRKRVDEILALGVCILRVSPRPHAQLLLRRFCSALFKLRSRGPHGALEDIWKADNNAEVVPGMLYEVPPVLSFPIIDQKVKTIQLDEEIDEVLKALNKSREQEYAIVEKCLDSQKELIQNLYQQLDHGRCEFGKHLKLGVIDAILSMVGQIKKEVIKLREMMQVSKGFEKTPKRILKEHFGLEIEEKKQK